MEIGKTLYLKNRKEWRKWLKENHKSEKEIWLIYYNIASGKPRIPYNDAVEEALCFGWIDSTNKKYDEESQAQRWTPRNKKSKLSILDAERIRLLIKNKKMTKAGLDAVENLLNLPDENSEPELSKEIFRELKRDPAVWENYCNFSPTYKRIRIGWIEGARIRPDEFKKRLNYFIKMTAKNKVYGMII